MLKQLGTITRSDGTVLQVVEHMGLKFVGIDAKTYPNNNYSLIELDARDFDRIIPVQ